MPRLKLSAPSGRDIDLSQFTGNTTNEISGWTVHANDGITEADAWVVLEGAPSTDSACIVPEGQFYFATAEVIQPDDFFSERPSQLRYLEQFDHVLTCHPLLMDTAERHVPFLPWMVNSNHGSSIHAAHQRDVNFFRELEALPKTKVLSVICSNKTYTPEQTLRLRFLERLSEHFSGQLDWFGNGIRSIPTKWDGLAPYRYTLALENKSAPDVITEKVQDAFLTLTVPIYWGAPNIGDYFDAQGLIQLDIRNWRASRDTIERLLAEDPYETMLAHLLENKRRVVDEMHYLRRLVARVSSGDLSAPRTLRKITQEIDFAPLGSRYRRAIGRRVQAVGAGLTR